MRKSAPLGRRAATDRGLTPELLDRQRALETTRDKLLPIPADEAHLDRGAAAEEGTPLHEAAAATQPGGNGDDRTGHPRYSPGQQAALAERANITVDPDGVPHDEMGRVVGPEEAAQLLGLGPEQDPALAVKIRAAYGIRTTSTGVAIWPDGTAVPPAILERIDASAQKAVGRHALSGQFTARHVAPPGWEAPANQPPDPPAVARSVYTDLSAMIQPGSRGQPDHLDLTTAQGASPSFSRPPLTGGRAAQAPGNTSGAAPRPCAVPEPRNVVDATQFSRGPLTTGHQSPSQGES